MEIGEVRHDLKNVLTALRSGCMLIEARLQSDDDPTLAELLEEMRAELDRGAAALERLRAIEQASKGT